MDTMCKELNKAKCKIVFSCHPLPLSQIWAKKKDFEDRETSDVSLNLHQSTVKPRYLELHVDGTG